MSSPEYLDLLHQMADLHVRKSAGYVGNNPDNWANFRMCEQFGITATDGVITRMSDKWSRLQALWHDRSNDQVGESITDTLMDLSAYSLILICLLNEQAEEESRQVNKIRYEKELNIVTATKHDTR